MLKTSNLNFKKKSVLEADAWTGLEFDLASRRKLPLLERDQSALGMASAWCPSIKLEGVAQFLGALYVTQGVIG